MVIDRCTDCGQDVGKREISGLPNICDECWNNRGWLVANVKTVGIREFQNIQHLMRDRMGGARRAIENFRYPSYSI